MRGMSEQDLRGLLRDIEGTRVAVLGDFCLDVYWRIDPGASERSLETGLETRPVAEQRCSLGGAGNVVANLVALGCRSVHALGVVGDDPWGREMRDLMDKAGVRTDGMLTETRDWSTLVYVKPHAHDAEGNRFDFGNFNRLPDEAAEALLGKLAAVLPDVDVVIVNEQVRQGVHTPFLRERLAGLIARQRNTTFLVDSRHFSDAYPGACLKLNSHEAARLIGVARAPEALVLREEAVLAAERVWERWQRPVFVTRGARGSLVRDALGLHEIPGIQIVGKVDTVGAGDSTLAGIALALAAGRPPAQAAELGGLVAAVTVRKLRQTGTASPEEVLVAGREPDYVHSPELAEDPRRARFHGETEIEVVNAPPAGLRVTHAVFDHDGTISSLRQGWEEVMEPMMVRAILGGRYADADESLYRQVVERVRDFIDKSTGIQTLVQMQGLVEMVREFGCVPAEAIQDAAGYKAIYNEALMERVRARVAKLRRGELEVADFTLKGAVAFLRALHAGGVRLYLASGTDEPDVRAEAEALGYADCFEGRIYGAVGDVAKEAKREVLERILGEVGAEGRAGLVTFGDGPVEIRETRRRGGLTVGVASDEIRRYGLSPAKRMRLVKAGADLVVPDFSQLAELLRLLGQE